MSTPPTAASWSGRSISALQSWPLPSLTKSRVSSSSPSWRDTAAYKYGNRGRIVALKLGGGPVPKPPAVVDAPFLKPTVARASLKQAAQGEILYNRVCSRCHVFGRG